MSAHAPPDSFPHSARLNCVSLMSSGSYDLHDTFFTRKNRPLSRTGKTALYMHTTSNDMRGNSCQVFGWFIGHIPTFHSKA